MRQPSPARTRRHRWIRRILAGTLVLLVAGMAAMAVLWHACPFPLERFKALPSSPCVTDRQGNTLLRRLGADQQWHLPVPLAEVSPWLVQATIAVEDERFHRHGGVDWLAVARAAGQNLAAGRRVSGASTLTMQLCRMCEDRPRTWRAKAVEAFRALQLERLGSKPQILQAYLNRAPYGGNLRGVEAASLAYFGKRAADLSLGEAALLAGLPQAPSRYRPDRFPEAAARRRETVLRRMVELGMIDERQRAAAVAEPVLASPVRLASGGSVAPHAAWLALQRRGAGGRTTIDSGVQGELVHLAGQFARTRRLPDGTDVAAVVIDIPSGDVVALLGSLDHNSPAGGQVCGPMAWRSPGSALKPFVYAAAFEARCLGPDSTLYDVPIRRGGWEPANFDGTFRGPVCVSEALRASLNVPAILTAEAVGLDRCTGLVRAAGVELPPDAPARGGLAVVTGAVEVRLLDLVNAYATLGRGGLRRPARLFSDEPSAPVRVLEANVCAAIDEILSSRARRPRGLEHLPPEQVPWFMWKTGTSSGRRDAWAVGHNGRYAVGVWVGRFSGAGDPAYVGGELAEPLLAQLMSSPRLRNDLDPAPAMAWAVSRPLPPPPETAGPLRILAPGDGAVYLAVQGQALVHPRSNHPGRVQWFLNGLALPPAQSERLVLGVGRYELRCVDAEGVASSVRFVVR